MFIEFIAKYWIEVGFGLICGTVAWVARHYIQLLKKQRADHENEIIKTMEKGLNEHKQQMREDMTACSAGLMKIVEEKNQELLEADSLLHEEIDGLRDGMLSMQGRNFKNDCHKLLKKDHIIDVKEYEQILADHIVYNKLGGNHEGDALFSMVEAKYRNTIGIMADGETMIE